MIISPRLSIDSPLPRSVWTQGTPYFSAGPFDSWEVSLSHFTEAAFTASLLPVQLQTQDLARVAAAVEATVREDGGRVGFGVVIEDLRLT